MSVSLPESSASTTWTTPEASKRYFNFESSSCHHLSHAPRVGSSRRLELPQLVEFACMVPVSRSG